jgi:hypothetical protein
MADAQMPATKASFSNTAKSTPAGMVVDRPMYTVTFPPEWKLDEKDEDFDLDHYFSIEAPGSCHVSFFLYASQANEKTSVDLQTSKMKEAVFKGDPAAVPFTTWGTLAGTGIELRGKMKPVSKGRVRSFMHAEATRSVLVNEFCFDEDLPAAQPGFDLISRSFRFH